MVWIVQGEHYDLKKDDLWLRLVWRINHKENQKLNVFYISPTYKYGRFGLERGLNELWMYAKDNRNSINRETILKYVTEYYEF